MKNKYFYLVLVFAAVYRLLFFSGHVFSDDSYYVELARLIFTDQYSNYVGYPINILRYIPNLFTGSLFYLFGESEFVSVLLPFVLSLISIFITWKIAGILFDETTALTAAIIHSLFPVDVIFATIYFLDPLYSTVVYASVFLLLDYNRAGSKYKIIFAGLLLYVAFNIKSMAIIPISAIGLIGWYLLVSRKKEGKFIIAAILVLGVSLFIESWVYYLLKDNLFYRQFLTNANYAMVSYDFFPANIVDYQSKTFLMQVLEQWGNNFRFLFVRRLYLFFPLLALVITMVRYKKENNRLLYNYFIIIVIALIFFSTSAINYQPVSLKFSWYPVAIFLPAFLIIAQVIAKFSSNVKLAVLSLYLAGSIYVCTSYQEYFDVANKYLYKEYISGLDGNIYTDHHCAYGTKLFVQNIENVKVITAETEYKSDDYIIFSKKKTDELNKQGFEYPDAEYYEKFSFVKEIGEFRIYTVK